MSTKSKKTQITTPATTPTPTAPTGTTAVENVPGTPANRTPITDLDPTDPTEARVNMAYCAVIRLGKALLAAVITAGNELAAAQRELGDGFGAFVTARTPWNLTEAHAMINFARQARLSPEGLTAAISVPLGRVLEAVALLGEIYSEQQE